MFWFTTALLVPFTFLVPSTSGRAAKARMVFRDGDTGGGFSAGDRARLSAILAIPTLLLIIASYFLWWKWTGLSLV